MYTSIDIPARKSMLAWQAVIFVVIVVGLLLRLSIVFNTPEALVRVMPDDAFYYFKTAHNILHGDGSTFDGLYATNGYHPLWMMLLVPVSYITDSLAFVRAALIISILLNLFTTLILIIVVRRVTASMWLAALGAALYFLSPSVVANNLNGLETSLATCLFAAAFYVIVIAVGCSLQYELAIGLLLGLLFLARTDMAFYIIILWLIAIARAATWQLRIRRGLIVLVAAGVVTAPWLAWSWVNFGSPLQVSGQAATYVGQQVYLLSGHTIADLAAQSYQALAFFLALGGPQFQYWIALFGLIIWLLFRKNQSELAGAAITRLSPVFQATLFLWLGSLALAFVHVFVRGYPRPWYFDQSLWLSILTVCLTAFVLGRRLFIKQPIARSGLVISIGFTAVLIGLQWSPPFQQIQPVESYPYQIELLAAAQWLKTNTAVNETAAAFNAGIIGYFSDRRVVNLDGVMNNAAFEAIQSRSLLALMHAADVRFLIDYDPVMLKLYAPFMGSQANLVKLQAVQIMDRPGASWSDSNVTVFQVDWQP